MKSKKPKSQLDSKKDKAELNRQIDVTCVCQANVAPQTIQVEQVLGANMAQRIVEFDLVVPENKPGIEQIIDVYVKNIEITAADIILDRVIVRGCLEVKVLYVADLPDQPVHAFERKNVKFTRDIEILGAEPGMKVNADTMVEFIDYDVDYEDDGCTCKDKINVTIVLKVWARVINTLKMQVYASEIPGEKPIAVLEEPIIVPEEPVVPEEPIEEPGEGVSGEDLEQGEDFYEEEYLEEEIEDLEEGIQVMQVTGNVVNVRNGPGTNFPVLAKVSKGDLVSIRDQAFGWFKVTLADDSTGWIASWLLTNVKG
ncbi:DUF3794 domain-containing protein [Selenomonadales bacterium OttesenSCG-928-I06]|nr:DUF3794 domain-containing protein [Selenomonadales bacterium OttesenSCG-928-I06]